MLQKTSHFMREANLIGGEWVQADSGATIDVTNPATGLKIGTVPKSGKAETRRAIEAAEEAFQSWKKTSALERHKLLRKLHDAHHGQPGGAGRAADHRAGQVAGRGEGRDRHLRRLRAVVRRGRPPHLWRRRAVALGRPAHPRHQGAGRRHRGDHAVEFPVLDAGAQARPGARRRLHRVVKPASQTPYSGLAWGVLAEEAGFPKGVINIVTGSAGEIGDEICANPLVKKITFTGSTEIGKMLIQKCAATVKKVSMELGGNAPFIVFDDADLDRAVEGAMVAKYRNSGQTCVCTNRFFVQAGIYDAFVREARRRHATS